MEATNYYEEEATNKFITFIRKNVLNFLLVLVVLGFLIKNLLSIDESGKTVAEIIADSLIAFIMGFTINAIMQKKGIFAAQETKSYKKMMSSYNSEIEKTNNYIEKLDDFCDEKNDQRLKRAQMRILRRERIKYSDFINGEKELVCKDKIKEKCWDRARKVKIHYMTPENLLSETDDAFEKGKREETLKQHERKEMTSSIFSKIIFALIFGYFAVSPVINGTNLLWSIFQVTLWLAFGLMTYFNNYSYVRNVYQQKIYRKINYLVEFNSRYGKKGEIKENGEMVREGSEQTSEKLGQNK